MPFPAPRRLAAALLLALAGLLVGRDARAQSSTEVVAGRVVGPDSTAIEGARIELTSTATGAVRRAVTRADGRFTILFREGGGSYRLRVTALGYAPANLPLQRQPDEERLDVTVHMTRTPQQLATVVVRGRSTQRAQAPPSAGAGSSQAMLPSVLLERLPLAMGDVASLAVTAPGVVVTPGSDSGGTSFSVGAQPATQNAVKVDGASFLFGNLPQEGVRAARVATSAYDVSRGQFTGGEIAMTTKSGTSTHEGTVAYTRRDPRIGSAGGRLGGQLQPPSQHLLAGSAGGPLVGDRAFFFASGQVEQRRAPLVALGSIDDDALRGLGVAPDSVRRLLALLAPGSLLDSRSSERLTRTGSGMVRIDWDATDRHAVLLRGDWRGATQRGMRVSPLTLETAGGEGSSDGLGLLATVTSALGIGTNELRVYATRETQDATPVLVGPSAVVYLASTDSQRVSVAPFQLGGNPSLPVRVTRSMLETGNDATSIALGRHRLRVGHVLTIEEAENDVRANAFGTYVYQSLADFSAGRPSMFTRSIGTSGGAGRSLNGGVWLGDAWRITPSLNVTFGARVEGSRWTAGTAGARLPAALGVQPGTARTEVHVSPRAGFSYLVGNVAGLPSGAISGGIGEFRGRVPTQLLAAVAGASGGAGGASQLVCVGDAAPAIDWNGDLGQAPRQCTSSVSAPAVPVVMGLDAGLAAPRVWRASLGGMKRFNQIWVLVGDASFLVGADNFVVEDRNLVGVARGTVDGGRPSFVDPRAIDARTGSVAPLASRIDPSFASVLALGSGLRSRTVQLTTTVQGPGIRTGLTTLSYTLQRSRDETNGWSFGTAAGTTAGDPRVRERGRSDFERRHNVQLLTLTSLPRAFELTSIVRVVSGAPYTPLVAGDVNGDAQSNDRARVPSVDDAGEQGAAMRRLLASSDAATRRCLASQAGRIAARNSCTTPWTASVDLQLNVRPTAMRLDRRLTLSLIAANVTAGVDRLLHGDDVRGWGQPAFPDRTLLQVTSFDPATRRYGYRVNESFGVTRRARGLYGAPFQLALQARVALGTDQMRAQMRSQLRGEGGKRLAVSELKTRLMTGVPNPMRELLHVRDSVGLALTPAQEQQITALRARYDVAIDSLIGVVAQIVSDAGPNPDPGQIGPKIQPIQMQLLKLIQQVVVDAKAVLTAEQWAKLPEWVKLPLQVPAPKRS
ncbi:MAG TPA: carboxypeptidase regulatory-like domain-containing protein [Gemmatimonadaceae bacterium]|nr:carboxypeptidase regulatory-like domain-containing protein [Gemmatimonadaceae bacterium]